MTRALLGGFFVTLARAIPAFAGDKDLADALRAGGFVFVVRHGATFAPGVDMDPLHPDKNPDQRQLNERGRAQAKTFGDALRQAGVPVGKVYTSDLNRAYQTAVLAGFTDIEKTSDLAEGRSGASPEEIERRAVALRRLLATPPRAGTNTVLVTHKPNIVDALGEDWSNVSEGEASIFRPANGTAKLVARVQTEEWSRIAMAK